MKTARELFEELGYTYEKINDEVIAYKYAYKYYTIDNPEEDTYLYEIDFCLNMKQYCIIENLGRLFMDARLHNAIHKQMEELGWLKDE